MTAISHGTHGKTDLQPVVEPLQLHPAVWHIRVHDVQAGELHRDNPPLLVVPVPVDPVRHRQRLGLPRGGCCCRLAALLRFLPALPRAALPPGKRLERRLLLLLPVPTAIPPAAPGVGLLRQRRPLHVASLDEGRLSSNASMPQSLSARPITQRPHLHLYNTNGAGVALLGLGARPEAEVARDQVLVFREEALLLW